MAENVEVRIIGDASGVKPAVEQAGASVGGLKTIIADINAFLDSARAKMSEFGGAGVVAGTQVAGAMHGAVAATEAEGNAITRMIMKVHEGAESVRTFQMRAKEFAEVYVALFAVEAISRWAEGLAAAAEKTEKLSATLAMSVPQVQALSGAAQMSGTDMDALTHAITILDQKSITAHGSTTSVGKALHAMGISATDGSTNMDRLLRVADKFHGMADGPTKLALSMELFGRNSQQILPFLNQGSAAIQQLMDKTKELGGVNEAAVEQGARLASSVNESKVAWEGLKQTLTQAFGPLLTQIVDSFIALVKAMHDSYESGGLVKIAFEGIVDVVSGVMEIFRIVGMVISDFFGSTGKAGIDWSKTIQDVVFAVVTVIKLIAIAFIAVKDGVLIALDLIDIGLYKLGIFFREHIEKIKTDGIVLGDFMKVVGKVCEDALMLHWGSIAADWDAGMAHIKSVVQQRANEIKGITADMRSHVQGDLAAISGTGNSLADFWKKMAADTPNAKHDGFKFNFAGGGGPPPDISPSGKQKKPKDTLVQELEGELEAKKVAWEKEQIAQGTAQQYSLESERDFWAKALQRTDLSAKDKLEIEKKWIAAAQAVQKEQIAEKLDGYKRELADADKNAAARLAILRREAADVHKIYGDKSKEARAADDAVYQAEKQAAEQRIRLAEETSRAMAAAQNDYVTELERDAQFAVEMGAETKAQLLQQERGFEQQRFSIDMAALQQRKLIVDPLKDPEQYAKILSEIESLERKHQATLNEIDRKAVLERTAIERQGIASVSSSWGQTLGQMLTLQKGFASSIKSLWQGLQQAIGDALGQIITNWLTKELTALLMHKAAHMAAAKGQIMGEAAVAGASGIASFAAAPWPIDLGAPAFGASMFSAAAAYAAVPGWDIGAWGLNTDQIGMVHKGENIIPAEIAGDMRDFFSRRADGPAAGNDNGGDTHLHFHGVVMSPAAMSRWARENRHLFGAGARAFVRQGGNLNPNARD